MICVYVCLASQPWHEHCPSVIQFPGKSYWSHLTTCYGELTGGVMVHCMCTQCYDLTHDEFLSRLVLSSHELANLCCHAAIVQYQHTEHSTQPLTTHTHIRPRSLWAYAKFSGIWKRMLGTHIHMYYSAVHNVSVLGVLKT